MKIIFSTIIILAYSTIEAQENDLLPYMAVIKNSEYKNATINDSVVFTIKANETFIYDPVAHEAYLSNGQSGYIPITYVKSVKSQFFKFNYPIQLFKLKKDDELFISASQKNINLIEMINNIIHKKEPIYLKQFVSLNTVFDGAALGNYYSLLWKIINYFNDSELSVIIESFDSNTKSVFYNLIRNTVVTFPIIDNENYYKLYYPQTLLMLNK